MNPMSRRGLLGATAAGSLAAAAKAPGTELRQSGSATVRRHQRRQPAKRRRSQSAESGAGQQMPWTSFNTAPRRIPNDRWARQVTQADFAISEITCRVGVPIGRLAIIFL